MDFGTWGGLAGLRFRSSGLIQVVKANHPPAKTNTGSKIWRALGPQLDTLPFCRGPSAVARFWVSGSGIGNELRYDRGWATNGLPTNREGRKNFNLTDLQSHLFPHRENPDVKDLVAFRIGREAFFLGLKLTKRENCLKKTTLV